MMASIWPLLVSFGLVLGLCLSLFFSWFTKTALRADISAEITNLEEQAESYRKTASKALIASEEANTRATVRANEKIKSERSELSIKRKEIEQLEHQCLNKITEAEKISFIAQQNIEKAHRKKTKAMAYAQRIKKRSLK